MKYHNAIRCGSALLLALAVQAAHAKTAVFDFEDQAFGATTALTSTQNGLSASFASATDEQGFQITGAFYKTLTGNYLAGPGPDFVTGNTLTIAFSQGVRAISLAFATDTDPALTLTTDSGFTASATGTAPGGAFLFPEGVLTYRGGYFRSVTLSSNALSFAIDNVTATVPEPSAFALIGMSLLGMGLARRRAA